MRRVVGLTLLDHLTYSTWHFEATATQAVSADLIQHQKDHCLPPQSPPILLDLDYSMEVSLHCEIYSIFTPMFWFSLRSEVKLQVNIFSLMGKYINCSSVAYMHVLGMPGYHAMCLPVHIQ